MPKFSLRRTLENTRLSANPQSLCRFGALWIEECKLFQSFPLTEEGGWKAYFRQPENFGWELSDIYSRLFHTGK